MITEKPKIPQMPEERPTAALLMCIYSGDRPTWVQQALQSVLTQKTDFKFNILIGVDGPVSNAMEDVLSHYSTQISIILRSRHNEGLTKSLNRLLEKACDHDFLFRQDADDVSLPGRMQKQYDYMCENPDVDVLGTAIFETSGEPDDVVRKIQFPETHSGCLRQFKLRDPLAHPSVVFRRTFFKKAGKYNEDYRVNQDTHLWLQGFISGCIFGNLSEPLLIFRNGSNFDQRRKGLARAYQLFKLRIKIAYCLRFPVLAYGAAPLWFIFTIAPPWVRKLAYRWLRRQS